MLNIPTKARHLFDHAAAQKAVGHSRGHEQGVDLIREAGVGVGQLQFKFEIAQRPQAAQDHPGVLLQGEVHR